MVGLSVVAQYLRSNFHFIPAFILSRSRSEVGRLQYDIETHINTPPTSSQTDMSGEDVCTLSTISTGCSHYWFSFCDTPALGRD